MTAVGRTPRPMNRFEERAMICDLASLHGGKRAVKNLVLGYVAAWARTQGQPPGFAPGSPEEAFSLSAQDWLSFHRGMLIGEVIPYLLFYLINNPGAPERTEYQHILVDEYQDLNQAEQDIIREISGQSNLVVIGDDDQSIYSFKFAHPEGIRQWVANNQGADDLSLTDCHRCPTRVVDMANALVSHNRQRVPRQIVALPAKGPGEVEILQFPGLDREASWIAEKIESIINTGRSPGEIIVLSQRRVVTNEIKAELRAKGVECISFYDESQVEAEEAQERFALLKLYIDREDRAALRFLLGMGHNDMRATQYARVRARSEVTGQSPWDLLVQLDAGQTTIPHTTPLLERFRFIQGELDNIDAQGATLNEVVDYLFPADVEELEDLRDAATSALESGVETADALLQEMIQTITQPEIPPTVDEVRLMSLHKSKGLSSPFVFIAGCVQGMLPRLADLSKPHAEQVAGLEEQRRLFYVGITRVKADPSVGVPGSLFLTHSSRMPVAMAHKAQISFSRQTYGEAHLQASLFLSELGPGAPQPRAG